MVFGISPRFLSIDFHFAIHQPYQVVMVGDDVKDVGEKGVLIGVDCIEDGIELSFGYRPSCFRLAPTVGGESNEVVCAVFPLRADCIYHTA